VFEKDDCFSSSFVAESELQLLFTSDILGLRVPVHQAVREAVREAATRAACRVAQVPPCANMEASALGCVLWLGATSPGTRKFCITSLLTNIALKKEYSKLTSYLFLWARVHLFPTTATILPSFISPGGGI
jgi:hypothetical protein